MVAPVAVKVLRILGPLAVYGELKAYNEMMNEARALATKRMVAEAEVMAYGTAVKFK